MVAREDVIYGNVVACFIFPMKNVVRYPVGAAAYPPENTENAECVSTK